MKLIIALFSILILSEAAMAQNPGMGLLNEKDTVEAAVEDMANGLYPISGNNDTLIFQVKSQIAKAVDANPTKSVDEVLEELIKETQSENKQEALRAKIFHAQLSACEEIIGSDKKTKESYYAKKYNEQGADEVQEGLEGKAKQLTAEVYAQASMVGKQAKFAILGASCMETAKKQMKQGLECIKNEKVEGMSNYEMPRDNTRVEVQMR